MTDITRREFVKVGAAGAAALAVGVAGRGRAPPDARAAARQDGLQGPDLQPRRPGDARDGRQHDESIAIINRAIDLGVNYIDTAAAYGRDRNVTAALGSQRHQPDEHRRGDEDPPQGGLPREQDRRPHARRLAEAARAEPEAAQHRSPRPVAAAQRPARRAARPDLRQGRRDRGAAEGARPEDGALPRHHRPLRSGRADERASSGSRSTRSCWRSTRPTSTTCPFASTVLAAGEQEATWASSA